MNKINVNNENKKPVLPEAYKKNMKLLLEDDYDNFMAGYELKPVKGLRFNTKKLRNETLDELKKKWNLEQIPWCGEGYYYDDSLRPGLSPYHDAGLYYIQEPSAMLTAEMADIRESDVVLDLCAAPGGKSTQAAVKCRFIVSNEPVAQRARILSSNIERMGFDNCIVTSAYPDAFAEIKKLAGFFDKVIVDAPCSGEGMMRKDETAVSEWSEANVAQCINRQAGILECAAILVKSGGSLVYSTCTFEKGENEEQISAFLERHGEFEFVNAHRIWPHKDRGEGHFCAVLKKSGKTEEKGMTDLNNTALLLKKSGIHILRCGIEPGETKKDKKGGIYYIPSHAEALAKNYDTDNGGKLNIISERMCGSYLKGESISLSEYAPDGDYTVNQSGGWVTVYYDRYPLGNGKLVNGVLKNHYPKGLRRERVC